MNNWKYELCSQIIESARILYKENGEHDIRFMPGRILKEEEALTVGDLKKKLSCLRDDLPIRSLNDDRYLTGFYNVIDIGNEKDAIYLVPDFGSVRHKD